MSQIKRAFSIEAPDQQRLKVARAEIEGVLRKHDLGGVVVLHTPGMSEFFYDVRPSYSCVWVDEQAQALRVKSLQADYGGDREAQRLDQAATANMVRAFANDLDSAAGMFASVAAVVDRAVQAEHDPAATFTPDPMEQKPQ